MNRYEFENLISDYLDGSMPFKKRIEFEYYIKNDPDAESLVKDVKNTIADMNNLHKVKVTDDFNEKLFSRLKKEGLANTPNNTILGFTPFYASLLSCLCIAFFVVVSQLLNLSQSSNANFKPNQNIAESEQNTSPYLKNIDLDKNLIVDSIVDTLNDKKEKEKPNNSNKIKFVNY
tara:strand:- start:1502 stop:2026 length:525 start_codon:yes stop_codon:yes gene_type:complete